MNNEKNNQGVNINNLPPLNNNLGNIDLPPMSSFTNFETNSTSATVEKKKDSVFDLINQFDAISSEKNKNPLNSNNVQPSLTNDKILNEQNINNQNQFNNIPFQEVVVTPLPTTEFIKGQNSMKEEQAITSSNILFDDQENNDQILNNDLYNMPTFTVDNSQNLVSQSNLQETSNEVVNFENSKPNIDEPINLNSNSINPINSNFSNIPPAFESNNQIGTINANSINQSDEINSNIPQNVPPIFAIPNENLTVNSVTSSFETPQASNLNDSPKIKNELNNNSMFEEVEPNISQIPIDLNPNVENQRPNVNPDNLVGNAPTILESNAANVQSNILAMEGLNQNIVEDVEATNANNAKAVFNDSLSPIINNQQEENMNNYINVLSDITGDNNQQNKIEENNIINAIKNEKPKKKKKKKKKVILIIIIVFLVIALASAAVFAYFLFFKTDKLVCEYQDYTSDQFLTSETMTMNFKGRQLKDASYIENVTFTESALAQKDEYLEELKNQFTGTDYNVSYSETDVGFQLSMTFTKEDLENWIGEKISNATKDNLQSEMESAGYTCK